MHPNLLEQAMLNPNSVMGRTLSVEYQESSPIVPIGPPVPRPRIRLIDVTFPWPLTVTLTLVARIPLTINDTDAASIQPTYRIQLGAQGAADVRELSLGSLPDPQLTDAVAAEPIRRELTVTTQSLQVDVIATTQGLPLNPTVNPAGGTSLFQAYVSPAAVAVENQRVSPVIGDIWLADVIATGTNNFAIPADDRRLYYELRFAPAGAGGGGLNLYAVRQLGRDLIWSGEGGFGATASEYRVFRSPRGIAPVGPYEIDNNSGLSARFIQLLSSKIGGGF